MKRRAWKKYWKRTRRNKLCAAILLIVGALSLLVDSSDWTCMWFSIMLSTPLLLAKTNLID